MPPMRYKFRRCQKSSDRPKVHMAKGYNLNTSIVETTRLTVYVMGWHAVGGDWAYWYRCLALLTQHSMSVGIPRIRKFMEVLR